jgi:hypothetical protein
VLIGTGAEIVRSRATRLRKIRTEYLFEGERDEAAGDLRAADGECARERAARFRLLGIAAVIGSA